MPIRSNASRISITSSEFFKPALQARLDNLRQPDGEPPHALDGPLSRADGPADPTRPVLDIQPLSPDELNVPLSGVDDLADLDLRLTRLPATDTTPPGSYRLELVDRTAGGSGSVRASDFTVELLVDSGRFVVIDPTGTTRFTFGPDGRFLALLEDAGELAKPIAVFASV